VFTRTLATFAAATADPNIYFSFKISKDTPLGRILKLDYDSRPCSTQRKIAAVH
jgi:hypothetical protein